MTCNGREIENRVLVNKCEKVTFNSCRPYGPAEPCRGDTVMSTNAKDMGRREGGYEREPARRVFAAELRECRYQFKDGEDEKSPTFVLLPSGER